MVYKYRMPRINVFILHISPAIMSRWSTRITFLVVLFMMCRNGGTKVAPASRKTQADQTAPDIRRVMVSAVGEEIRNKLKNADDPVVKVQRKTGKNSGRMTQMNVGDLPLLPKYKAPKKKRSTADKAKARKPRFAIPGLANAVPSFEVSFHFENFFFTLLKKLFFTYL